MSLCNIVVAYAWRSALKLPPLGWSSWVALGSKVSIFDFCDEESVKAAIDAFVSPDLGFMKRDTDIFILMTAGLVVEILQGICFLRRIIFQMG